MSRFREPQDPAFRALNTSLGFDRRLWPHDIAQSRAHARMLAAQGIISESDRDGLLAGLDAVAAELRDGTFPFAPGDEDIHMAVERRLTELAGPVGGRLHTARSRNDQVATDVALFTREAALRARGKAGELIAALIDAAERHLDWALPGYTHLQRAQPIYLSHHLLAYAWMLQRDRARFAAAAGAAAVMAATNWPRRSRPRLLRRTASTICIPWTCLWRRRSGPLRRRSTGPTAWTSPSLP